MNLLHWLNAHPNAAGFLGILAGVVIVLAVGAVVRR